MKRRIMVGILGLALLAAAWQMQGCAGAVSGAGGGMTAAQKTYVKPGEHDAYYAFLSGGHHGNIYVYGIPS